MSRTSFQLAMCLNLTIGITGGIGSGKSVVSRVLRCNGFKVYDCDSEAKKLMERDQEVRETLIGRFGNDIYLANGHLNRTLLASYIFTDAANREFVNKVVHSAVRNDIIRLRAQIDGWLFIEAAILASGGISQFCSQVWIVTAPETERIRRVRLRDNLSLEEISKRLRIQERELELLENENTLFLENNGKNPLLPEILTLTNRIKNNQTYILSC